MIPCNYPEKYPRLSATFLPRRVLLPFLTWSQHFLASMPLGVISLLHTLSFLPLHNVRQSLLRSVYLGRRKPDSKYEYYIYAMLLEFYRADRAPAQNLLHFIPIFSL